jgi:hypothetical protein
VIVPSPTVSPPIVTFELVPCWRVTKKFSVLSGTESFAIAMEIVPLVDPAGIVRVPSPPL